jgi:hypothetical protein
MNRYEVEAFNAEEIVSIGSNGIKLKPIDDGRRVWHFKAENEEDQNEWIEVFICYHFVLFFIIIAY